MAMRPITGGDLWVELDVGYANPFTLDDPVRGKLNGLYALDGTTKYADINVKQIETFQGKKRVTDSIAPGRCVILADDPNRLFDPLNTASIYYNTLTGAPGLSPLRRVRVFRRIDNQALSRTIFYGRVVDFTYDYVGPKRIPQVTISCADDLFILANTSLDGFTPTQELASDRVEAILDLPEIDWPLDSRDITASKTTLGAYPIAEGTNALEYLRQIDRAERGRIFIQQEFGQLIPTNGLVKFEPRAGNTFSDVTVEFTDNSPTTDKDATPYREVFIEYSSDTVINRAIVERVGGAPQTVTDSASISAYFTQSETITGSLLSDDAQALELANYLLNGTPEPRFSGVVASFLPMSDDQRDACLLANIGRTIKVTKSFSTGSPSSVTEELAVEGISYRISLRDESMTFYTSPTNIVYPLKLNDSTRGKLDDENAVA